MVEEHNSCHQLQLLGPGPEEGSFPERSCLNVAALQ